MPHQGCESTPDWVDVLALGRMRRLGSSSLSWCSDGRCSSSTRLLSSSGSVVTARALEGHRFVFDPCCSMEVLVSCGVEPSVSVNRKVAILLKLCQQRQVCRQEVFVSLLASWHLTCATAQLRRARGWRPSVPLWIPTSSRRSGGSC